MAGATAGCFAVCRFFKASKSKSETVNKLRRQEWIMLPSVERNGLDTLIKANISRVYDAMKLEARKKEE